MAKLIWAVLCSRVVVDKESNSVSYIDAVEGFSAAGLPAPAPLMFACALWERDEPGLITTHVRARVLNPEGLTIGAGEVRSQVAPQFIRQRTHIALGGYGIESPGRYEIVLEQELKDGFREEARIPFVIGLIGTRAEAEEEQAEPEIAKA